MPVFDSWWQGLTWLTFGVITTVGMLVIASFFHRMWKKYEDKPQTTDLSCDAHHH